MRLCEEVKLRIRNKRIKVFHLSLLLIQNTENTQTYIFDTSRQLVVHTTTHFAITMVTLCCCKPSPTCPPDLYVFLILMRQINIYKNSYLFWKKSTDDEIKLNHLCSVNVYMQYTTYLSCTFSANHLDSGKRCYTVVVDINCPNRLQDNPTRRCGKQNKHQ